jgi:hypothetical protein
MGKVHDVFSSRNNIPTLTIDNHVGNRGRLFYDEETGVIRVSDGVTPGGLSVPITLASTTRAGAVKPGAGFTIGEDALLSLNAGPMFQLDANNVFQLKAGTDTIIGGVKSGNGIIIASDGTINLDTEGLSFVFGDFFASTPTLADNSTAAALSSVNENETIVIASNGTGGVAFIGKFDIYPTNGDIAGALAGTPVFSVDSQGDISARSLDIQETGDLNLMAALNVTINSDGLTKTPTVVTGSVAQFTGRDNRTAILVLDSYGLDVDRSITGGEFVFRTGRGTNLSTTPVLAGDRLGQVVAAGWASNGYGGVGVGGMRIVANENYTSTARGSKLELVATPNGTITPAVVATVDSTGITMAPNTKLIGTSTTADNLTAASGILAGTISVNPGTIIRSSAVVRTYTLTGITTNHKIVITSGTAIGFGVMITAAWASALNTLSVEFQNFTGNTDITLGAKTIQYFAWI